MLVSCRCGRWASRLPRWMPCLDLPLDKQNFPLFRKCYRPSTDFHVAAQRLMSSMLYQSRYEEGTNNVVEVDLDLTERFKNIRTLYENIRHRNLLDDVNVYHLASMHKALRDVEKKKIELEDTKTDIGSRVAVLIRMEQTEAVKSNLSELFAQGKEIREALKEVKRHYYQLEEEVTLYGLQLPSDLHQHTPIEEDEVLNEMGNINKEISRKPVGHMLIGKKTGTIFKKNVGPIKYYLRNEAADLEKEISYRLCQKLRQFGFTPMCCPDMVRPVIVEGTGQNIINPKEAYVIEDKDHDTGDCKDVHSNSTHHLVGASPQAFAAAIMKMNIQENSLPLKWFSAQTSYNPSRSVEYSDLFASPQSEVVELFGAVRNEDEAGCLYREIYTMVWSLCSVFEKELQLRQVSRCAPRLAQYEAGRVDIEAWSYGLHRYVTVGSVAMWSDFIGRRLMSKWSPKVNDVLPGHFLHTVHGTAFNVTTLVGLLMEACQTSSGHFKLPEDILHGWSSDMAT